MFPLMSPGEDVATTQSHCNLYAREGLRTLVLGQRNLTDSEYQDWAAAYSKASTDPGDREKKLEALAAELEDEFQLLGATASEDKLQDGVPECIKHLRLAGIQVWMLTGAAPLLLRCTLAP